MQDEVKITAHPSQNPEVCQFRLSAPLLEKGSIYITSKEEAHGSPLLSGLMDLPGISEILLTGSTFNLKKKSDKSWRELGPLVGQSIRDGLKNDRPLGELDTPTTQPAPQTKPQSSHPSLSTELGMKLIEVLEQQITPALAAHGGHVQLVKIEDDLAYLSFGGGCQGCSQVSVTVKQGVEGLLKKTLPEIKGVVDITDHALGDNPYYK